MKIAQRIQSLGTETAFAVSAEATAHAAKGNKVYPFHLGDIDLPTPQTVVDAAFHALKEGKNTYCPAPGVPALRKALAADINASHGTNYTMDNVVVQPGGKPVIGKFIQTLMSPGDEVLYPNPGYPIYESQIEYFGGKAVPYSYKEGPEGFELDLEALESSITNRTTLLVFNDFQNPMAAEASEEELEQIARIVKRHNLMVLCDEAYFDIRYSGQSRSLTSFEGMEERCVILYTFSKKFAMTGWRLGAAIAPLEVAKVFAKLNTNDESCSNHFIQYGAVEGLKHGLSETKAILDTLNERRLKGVELLNSIKGVRCYTPQTTFYLFPNVTELMKSKGFSDENAFRKAVLEATGVSFCTRLHFGRGQQGEENKYVRFAYSGIPLEDLVEGLNKFKLFVEGK